MKKVVLIKILKEQLGERIGELVQSAHAVEWGA